MLATFFMRPDSLINTQTAGCCLTLPDWLQDPAPVLSLGSVASAADVLRVQGPALVTPVPKTAIRAVIPAAAMPAAVATAKTAPAVPVVAPKLPAAVPPKAGKIPVLQFAVPPKAGKVPVLQVAAPKSVTVAAMAAAPPSALHGYAAAGLVAANNAGKAAALQVVAPKSVPVAAPNTGAAPITGGNAAAVQNIAPTGCNVAAVPETAPPAGTGSVVASTAPGAGDVGDVGALVLTKVLLAELLVC